MWYHAINRKSTGDCPHLQLGDTTGSSLEVNVSRCLQNASLPLQTSLVAVCTHFCGVRTNNDESPSRYSWDKCKMNKHRVTVTLTFDPPHLISSSSRSRAKKLPQGVPGISCLQEWGGWTECLRLLPSLEWRNRQLVSLSAAAAYIAFHKFPHLLPTL